MAALGVLLQVALVLYVLLMITCAFYVYYDFVTVEHSNNTYKGVILDWLYSISLEVRHCKLILKVIVGAIEYSIFAFAVILAAAMLAVYKLLTWFANIILK